MRNAFALSFALLWLTSSQTEREAKPSQEIMWKKLDLSHGALDAIALEDFEALEAYASDLVALSVAGELNISNEESYKPESREFREAALALGKAAHERKIEAAALAYVDLTLRCMSCHRSLGALPRR
ncbi:MAG TPA: hypothetical protein VIE88_16705 [Vicinamibacteria bacterium]|jgi:hypothetical protein